MEENSFGWVIILLIILIGIWLLFLRNTPIQNLPQNYIPTSEEANNLTNYLNSVGATLYYEPNCPYCIQQENYINFTLLENKIDISNQTINGIQGVPAWNINGTIYYGVKDYKTLSELS